MNMSINTPGLAGLFDALAGSGGVNDLISADLNRARRDQLGVETQIKQTELAAAKRQQDQLAALQQILLDPALGTTPEGRASLISVLAGVPDGLEMGPEFGLGATTFVNPEALTPGDLSLAAFGTGVQPDYSKSPDGVLAGLMNAFDINAADNQTALQQEQIEQAGLNHRHVTPGAPGATGTGAGGTPPLVNGSVLKALGEQMDAEFAASFPGANVDPALRQDVLARASELYQTTRNAQTAVRQAMLEANAAEQGAEGWFEGASPNPFELFGVLPKSGTVRGFLPDPAAPVATDAPQATTPVQQPSEQPAQTGVLAVDQVPPSLRNVQRDPETGGYFLIQNGKAVPLKEGQTAVSASNPNMRLVFRGGSWMPM